uniref:Uncharacterized protein n=1 Tax=Oryza meridionalis TaxID=40149 RepID=A0A0E0EUK4_9ORYZ
MASGKADVGVGGGEAMRRWWQSGWAGRGSSGAPRVSDGEAAAGVSGRARRRRQGPGARGRGDQKSRTELGQSKGAGRAA